MIKKRYQMFHRYNSKFKPPLEERICVWFEWEGEVTEDNEEEFNKVVSEALQKQAPPYWFGIHTGNQKENMARGAKYSPQLSWSTVMHDSSSDEEFETPLFNKDK